VVTVEAEIDSRFTTGDSARRELRSLMDAELRLPDGYAATFSGEEEEQGETTDFLAGVAFPVAVLLVVLVLVAQFNSLLYPMIILTEVGMSVGGAFLGLYLFNLPFSVVMAGVALISLAGVVVNNGIILVDYTIGLIRGGLPPREAVVVAGVTRLRPVLLTAVTTMLGVMPIVIGVSLDVTTQSINTASETAQFWKTMAVVTVFGLAFATFLTLFAVPVMFSLLHGMKAAVGGRAGRVPHWCVWRFTALWWEVFDVFAKTHFAAKWHGKLARLRVRGEIEVWETEGRLLE
jgi:multidrug efflux pump subunit AcrB